MSKKVIIIGAGFSSLSAACYLSKEGFDVTILEKNKTNGGRASQLKRDGFTFDMGPTFYWMPDVFEKFFSDFGKSVSDFYVLDRLEPAYKVVFGANDDITVPGTFKKIKECFDKVEHGSSRQLQKFIDGAQDNYEVAIKDLVYNPGESLTEIITPKTALKLGQFFRTVKGDVRRYLKDDRLKKILEFPVLFLGAKPETTPAFYNFMNYADFVLGTWYPKGGMFSVVKAMEDLAFSLGVKILNEVAIDEIVVEKDLVSGVSANNEFYQCNILLSGADYHHTEKLLPSSAKQYSEKYWDKKTYAPSALLFYIGFNKKLSGLEHHTLFFDSDFDEHAKAIYDEPSWPEDPLFYTSFPSLTDNSAAPVGKEAGIILIPLAPDIEDTTELREKYFEIVMERIEKYTGEEIKSSILFKESFCVSDFKSTYNSYKGNAYGLANTLLQTHILRPKIKSKKLKNLYFTGQLTVPGPGVPPSLISGKIASELIIKHHQK